jgi:hypothetical protein
VEAKQALDEMKWAEALQWGHGATAVEALCSTKPLPRGTDLMPQWGHGVTAVEAVNQRELVQR